MKSKGSLGNNYWIFRIKPKGGAKPDYWLAIKTKAIAGLPKSTYPMKAIVDYYKEQEIFLYSTTYETLNIAILHPRLLKYKGRNLAIDESTEIETYTIIDRDRQVAYYKDKIHQIRPVIFDYKNNMIFYKILKDE